MPVVSSGHPSTHRRSILPGHLSLGTKSSSLFVFGEDALAPRSWFFVVILAFEAVIKRVTRCHHVCAICMYTEASQLTSTFKSADQRRQVKVCQLLHFSLLLLLSLLDLHTETVGPDSPIRKYIVYTYGFATYRACTCDRPSRTRI